MRGLFSTTGLAAILMASASLTHAFDLNTTSNDSILVASKNIVRHILTIYNNNGSGPAIPGLLPDPYYWWEAGYMFDSLINYWSLSGDPAVVPTIQDGMLFQIGSDNNYMPVNQTKSIGNDDQAFWGLAAMTAAERGFPVPERANVTWVELAQNVFNDHVARWDDSSCDGGLRWQIFTFNAGYNYKNSLSQGTFALLAARLARFTGNETYSEWAQKAVDWTKNVGLISEEGVVFDGTDSAMNCSQANREEWTIASGVFLEVGAVMVNMTETSVWNSLLWPIFSRATNIFTDSSVLTDIACTRINNCNTEQKAFKATLARALADFQSLTASSPSTYNGTSSTEAYSRASAILRASAEGAAAQCSGGIYNTTCGFDWTTTKWDGTSGIGQDLDALEVILANLPATGINTANSTVTGSSSNDTSTEGGNGTQTGSASSASSSTSGAVGIWSSSAMVALFSAAVISLLRLTM